MNLPQQFRRGALLLAGVAGWGPGVGLAADDAGPVYYFTTLAGATSAGGTDGIGAAARFNRPAGIAADGGVCYVADTNNHTIRRVTPDGTVTTFAGAAGEAGYVDGPAAVARFRSPYDLALDREGNLYVLDGSRTVRKVTPQGFVSTLAGTDTPGDPVDGQGPAARFYSRTAIAVAPDGDIWVAEGPGFAADFASHWWARLRRVTPDGRVTTERVLDGVVEPHTVYTGLAFDAHGILYACDPTYEALYRVADGTVGRVSLAGLGFAPLHVAVGAAGPVFLSEGGNNRSRIARLGNDNRFEIIGGQPEESAPRDGTGPGARFAAINGLAVDETGALYLPCEDNTVRLGVVAGAPVIRAQPHDLTVAAGGSVQFSVQASAVPEPTYQWYYNRDAIGGATAATYSFLAANPLDAGEYYVVVTNELGSTVSNRAVLTIASSPVTPPPSGGPGGGGGAPSAWFVAALAALAAARRLQAGRHAGSGQ